MHFDCWSNFRAQRTRFLIDHKTIRAGICGGKFHIHRSGHMEKFTKEQKSKIQHAVNHRSGNWNISNNSSFTFSLICVYFISIDNDLVFRTDLSIYQLKIRSFEYSYF